METEEGLRIMKGEAVLRLGFSWGEGGLKRGGNAPPQYL